MKQSENNKEQQPAPQQKGVQGNNAPDNTSGSGDNRQAKINLPTGGGAVRGIGEKFQANPVTGTASFTVPLTISEGRGGFSPQLALSYDSGSGNSAFGLGWNVGLPSISRKTDKGLPQYNDNSDNESDTFILSDAEDLVPVWDGANRMCRQSGNYEVYTYQPRTEGLFALIERWKNTTNGISHWRTISKENIVSVFGFNAQARIADPDNPQKIFSWLLEESWDTKGNLMRFSYKQEDDENVEKSCYEKHRLAPPKGGGQFPSLGGVRVGANKYLKEIAYGNETMCLSPLSELSNYSGDFHFRLLFDYGEHIDNEFIPNDTWLARQDAFSNYKAGFEIRTYRLCRRVLMFHSFAALGQSPVLVRSTDLEYEKNASFSLLKSVTHKGYEGANQESLPPLDFTYTQSQPADCFKEVEEHMLRHLPAGIDGQNYQWADLYSEGVSGILTMNNQAWYFAPPTPPEGGEKPRWGGMKSEVPKPAAANNRRTTFRLNDIDSDGFPELVIQGDGINGFYSRDEEGKWLNFRNFEKNPNINYNDANLRFMDLSGNGLSDIVISKGETFDIYFSEGKKGFDNYRRVRCGKEQGNAPQILFSDPKQTVFLADMSGDGLTDIVKINNQSIVYYPNMGYGKFGEEVVMSNPPLLDSKDQFNARFVHLVDVDGTGTADLLYIAKGKIRYFKNLSGNAWEEQNLPNTLSVNATQQTFIQTTDLLGNGTQCIVVSSSLPAQAKKMRYWELASPNPSKGGGFGSKPFLLSEINNNMGGITRLHYASSTKFYMQDKLNGKPWITKLPFPVQVLEKVEIIDLVGDKHFTNRYAYHHGYYDAAEREFRGFGMVEQWDTENYELGIMNYDSPLAPVYTKTWFHTGFYGRRQKISRHFEKEYFNGDTNAWLLPDTVLPENLSGEEAREAARALKGSPLRIEIYAAPPSPPEGGGNSPLLEGLGEVFTIEEKSYSLKCLQNKGKNKHAVFLKTESESLMYHYERQLNDPRILHKLVLETDEFGNELKSAEIAYPRQAPPSPPEGGEYGILGTYTENDFINDSGLLRSAGNDAEIINLIGIPYQSKQYEIHNLNFTNSKFEAKSLLNEIEQANTIDYAATPSGTEKRLIQHSKTLFWNENGDQVLPFGKIAPQALPYQQQSLEFTQELVNQFNSDGVKLTNSLLSNDCKYLQDGQNWYAVSDIQHFDKDLFYLPVRTVDAWNNETTIDYDTYNIYVKKVTDALNFETTAEYDYRILQPYKLTDPNGNSQQVAFDTLGMVKKLAVMGKNNEGDTLAEPTEEYNYDLHCWKNEQKPVFAHVKKRETHGIGNTRFLESYVYTDGLGNEIMTKTTAEDGDAWTIINDEKSQIPTTNRWLASGKKIFDNKGNIVKQYEPWYSITAEFENEEQLTHYGVTPVFYYDPLNRLIKTDFPDGTTSRVEFNAWEQKNYDQNDCDESSPHYNTPQVIDLDVLGRPFRTTDDNGNFGDSCVTTNQLDITGRILAVTDGLGRIATQNLYALSEKHLLAIDNIDSGKRWLLNDTAGKPVKKWDSRNNEFTFNYDVLQRPTDTVVNGICTERLIYGTDDLQNNIGQIIESYAQDGKTCFEYDFKGNVVLQTKQFAEDYNTLLDWNNVVSFQLSVFSSETTFDALNRPVTVINPDNSVIGYVYDKGGMLQKVLKDATEHITNIEYNEKGQRLNIYYGNNTKTRYYYNVLNFRLERILTTRNAGQDILQDLNYEFDAVGNITKITDDAQQTHYFNNQVIAPTGTYEYDALYRLTKATGRELTSLTAPTHEDFANDIYCPDVAGNAMQNYLHNYQYDALGNMLSDNWKDYVYDTVTNRLLKHDALQNLDDYSYDAHGNMLTMPHLNTLNWDYKDQLISASNGTFTSYYNYDSQGNRTRKVVEKGNITETRYYVGGYEVFRKETNNTLDFERTTLNISDDEKVFVRVEQKTGENEVVRYQYDNHLGSACLELDEVGDIISYEEYHPFGTTSYRSGRSETEVSLKRYKYNGKERDEETGLYAYGMRYYAAWLCRFVSVDPLQFKYPHYTPYQYAGNKPITYIDLDGGEEEKPEEKKPEENQKGIVIDDKGYILHYDPESTDLKVFLNGEPIGTLGDEIDASGWLGNLIQENSNYVNKNLNGVKWRDVPVFFGGTLLGGGTGFVLGGPVGLVLGGGTGGVASVKSNKLWDFAGLVGEGCVWDYKYRSNYGNERLRNLRNKNQPKYNKEHILGVAFSRSDDSDFGKKNLPETKFKFAGFEMRAQDVNNFHYGVVGKVAGIPESLLRVMAGYVEQMKQSKDKKDGLKYDKDFRNWINPRDLGDNPTDSRWIQEGFKYYNNLKK